jgi:hypothetical protein
MCYNKNMKTITENANVEFAIKNTSKPNDLVMSRYYWRDSGEYAGTMLVVRGPNGKVAKIYDLTPAEIGQLTHAGIKKL